MIDYLNNFLKMNHEAGIGRSEILLLLCDAIQWNGVTLALSF